MSSIERSLEEISEDYPIILVDTSVLIGHLNRGDTVNRSSSFNTTVDSAHFFKKHIDNGMGIYVTPYVFREYSNGGSSSHRRLLLDAIRDNSRILQLNGGEKLWYDVIFKGYFKIRDKFELAETDYDFLVSGVVLSDARKKPIALVSNDLGILRAWKSILMKESISPEKLGFLIRIGDYIFKRIKPPKDYKKL